MIRILGLGLILLPGMGLAQSYSCSFDTTCFMQEACESTEWEMTLAPEATGWSMSSIAGDRALEEMAEEDGHLAFISRPENGAVALMTLADDGTAIYSELSLSGGYAVTDYGRCSPES